MPASLLEAGQRSLNNAPQLTLDRGLPALRLRSTPVKLSWA